MRGELSPNGDIRYVYLFLIIAFFVLVIACVNFINLSTARSASRSKEVGMRKIVGANRSQLIRQFMGESILLALVALLFAVVLIEVSLPCVQRLYTARIGIGLHGKLACRIGPDRDCVICRAALWNLPRLFSLGFPANGGVKKHAEAGIENVQFPQNARSYFSFVISIVLIIGTVVVYDQVDYIRNKKLGFDKEHVIVMPDPGKQVTERYKSRLSGYANVLNTSKSSSVPGPTC